MGQSLAVSDDLFPSCRGTVKAGLGQQPLVVEQDLRQHVVRLAVDVSVSAGNRIERPLRIAGHFLRRKQVVQRHQDAYVDELRDIYRGGLRYVEVFASSCNQGGEPRQNIVVLDATQRHFQVSRVEAGPC